MDMLLVNNDIVHEGMNLLTVIPACPSSYHEFEGPEALPYDNEGQLSFEIYVYFF